MLNELLSLIKDKEVYCDDFELSNLKNQTIYVVCSKDLTMTLENCEITIYEILNANQNISIKLNLINCHINYYKINIFNNSDTFALINLKNKSYLNIMNLSLFNTNSNLDIQTNLNDESNISEYNVYIGTNNKSNVTNSVKHANSKTTSIMTNLVLAKELSQFSFITNGFIIKNAKKCDLSQKTKGLLLSEKSRIKAVPNLFIDEFDTLASHGAGVGAISMDDIYYLMSRGLTRELSCSLIVDGFINPILNNFDEEFSNVIKKYI